VESHAQVEQVPKQSVARQGELQSVRSQMELHGQQSCMQFPQCSPMVVSHMPFGQQAPQSRAQV
jgi:hypothetical protein